MIKTHFIQYQGLRQASCWTYGPTFLIMSPLGRKTLHLFPSPTETPLNAGPGLLAWFLILTPIMGPRGSSVALLLERLVGILLPGAVWEPSPVIWLGALPQLAQQLRSLARHVIPTKPSYIAKTVMPFLSKVEMLGPSLSQNNINSFLFV